MPNPELSQYRDHDTNTVYDLKDATARADINNLNTATQRNIIALYFPSTETSSGYTQWGFTSASENYGYFDGHDMQMVRVVFNSNLADFTKPVQFIYYGDYERGVGAYICDVFSDWLMTDSINGIYKNGEILDFIFSRYENCFVLVGKADAVDLSNYYTKTQTDTLLNAKVSDNPTFTEAATRSNIASGETFAVILGKIKKFFSDLKAVAFSGSYNDLTDTPTIPAAQVNSDWNANSGVAEILNKPTLAPVATSGDYDDLTNQPTIPSALSDLSDDSTHRVVTDTEKSTWSGKVSDNPTFSEASTRANIASGESFATILGKIKKFFTDLKTVAFTGSYNDLSNTPTIPTSNDYIQKTNGHANGSIDIDSMSGSVSQIAVHGNGSQDANIVANQSSFGNIGMRIDGNGYKEIYAANSNFQDDILLSIDDNRVIGGILGGKQDALTAGSNISISGNTISVQSINGWTLPKKGDSLTGGGSSSSLRFNTIGASLTGGGKQLYVHLPFPFPPSLPNITYCRIAVRQAQNANNAYVKEGTSYYALDATNTQATLMNNGTKRSSVSSISFGELGIHGFNMTVNFEDALAVTSSGTAMNNNSPISMFIELKGTWST